MNGKPPTKIFLDNSTSVSLNDRFTTFTRERMHKNSLLKVRNGRKLPVNRNIASAKNRRLARTMVNRPAVRAALKLKKRSIIQRVGGTKRLARGVINLNSRLNQLRSQQKGINGRLGARNAARRSITSRLSAPTTTVTFANNGAGFTKQIINRRSNAGLRLNRSIQRRNALNANGKFIDLKLSLKRHFGRRANVQSRLTRIGVGNGRRRLPLQQQQQQSGNYNGSYIQRGRRRPGQNMRRRGAKRVGRGGMGRQIANGRMQPKTKETLDQDIDKYMAKTKSHLDHDLDAYMSHAN